MRLTIPVLQTLVGRADRCPVLAVGTPSLIIGCKSCRKIAIKRCCILAVKNRDIFFVAVLAVALGCSQGIKLQTVVLVDVPDGSKIVSPGIGPCMVHCTVTCLLDHCAVESVLPVDQTGIAYNGGFHEAVIADLLLQA